MVDLLGVRGYETGVVMAKLALGEALVMAALLYKYVSASRYQHSRLKIQARSKHKPTFDLYI